MGARDVIIIGGGLSGLTSAIHLSKAGLHVTVIEKNTYPLHKVCGEYVSNEVLPYLASLGADPAVLGPSRISRLIISDHYGKTLETALPLGGFGISRYAFDQFLMQQTLQSGVELITDTVTNVFFENDRFFIDTNEQGVFSAPVVLGAYGKRAALDLKLSRPFINEKSPWLAVKGHYRGEFPADTVGLYNFDGGYCGVSKVEDDILNICYLVSYESFKSYKHIEAHQEQVLARNTHLKDIFERSTPLFDKPLTISQVSFSEKEKVVNHILMTGDTAGLIHPLCGNGMAMAIQSAQIASENVLAYFNATARNRPAMEQHYTKAWNKMFSGRMRTGRLLSRLFSNEKLSATMMKGLILFPGLLPGIIRRTHGKPLKGAEVCV
ncbi:NAD(P)/FAD-dependent oxidoreductase [Chitinophaga sp. Ak27]|uniref:NAD(P)/FAD-dependent oxidoreductase n=1 Tax=Chitinophaga sp. Ak27 TaxID=2726116 RepID=UPI00145D5AD1|nr:NAD(P)/FAD-dependent oxidoreductase [Chitinophaga sp. Ak27]NLU90928.1 NAD(P)/FAD-dependent oxidoreductase [Chitinophaga sp. Ak27]